MNSKSNNNNNYETISQINNTHNQLQINSQIPAHFSANHSITEAPLTLFDYYISFGAQVAMCYYHKVTQVFPNFVVMIGCLPDCRSGKALQMESLAADILNTQRRKIVSASPLVSYSTWKRPMQVHKNSRILVFVYDATQ